MKSGTVNGSAGQIRISPYLHSKKKRGFDVFLAIVGLLVMLMMLPVVGLLIKINSRGPIFFTQPRLGLDGRSFNVLKFRTMVNDAEILTGPVWAGQSDPRITSIGNLLRKTYIDEFPQWWNVIKGEMSAVGPRPERQTFSDRISKTVPSFNRRLHAKPGITGLAQTQYRYAASITDSRHKLSYDVRYISGASLKVDVWLIIMTVRTMLLRHGT